MPLAVGYTPKKGIKCNKNGAGCKIKDRAPNAMIAGRGLAFAWYWEDKRKRSKTYTWYHLECVIRSNQYTCRKMYKESNVEEFEGYTGLKAADKARVDAFLGIVRMPASVNGESAPGTLNAKMDPNASHSASPESTTQGSRNQDVHPPEAQEPDLKPRSTPAPAPRAPAFAMNPSDPPEPQSRSRAAPPSDVSPGELNKLGNRHYRDGEYEIAVSYYAQAIDLKSDPTFFSNRAKALIALKRFKPASDDCHVAALLTHHAPDYKTLARLAKCHLALGEPEAAVEAAKASIDCDSSLSADNPALATKASAELMKQHLDRCMDAWERKAWTEVKQSLSEASTLCEGDRPAEWCVWEVEIAMARCEWAEAVMAAKSALELHPNSAGVLAAAAKVDLFTNHLPTCVILLRAALRTEPGNACAGSLLPRVEVIMQAKEAGNWFYRAGLIIDASKEYSHALDFLGSKDEEGQGGDLRVALLGNRATTYTQMKRFDLARDDCLATLSIPNHPWRLEALEKLARCYIALGDPRAALQHIATAQEVAPLDHYILEVELSARAMLSDLRQSRESWAKKEWLTAKQALARAIAKCTGDCPMQWCIWKVEMELSTRSWDDAVSTAESAAKLYPTSAHLLALLGLTRMLSNNLALCLEPLQVAVDLDPGHSFASRTLSRAKRIERSKAEGDKAFESGSYTDAVRSYTETLDIIGSDDQEGGGGHLRAGLLANRAAALLEIERPSEALADIVVSLELQATSSKALRIRARICMAQGSYEQAVEIYIQARKAWGPRECDVAERGMIIQELLDAEAALEMSRRKDFQETSKAPWGDPETDLVQAIWWPIIPSEQGL
ncbi:hypothetical protein FRB96_001264 [Tulasnella sp. 330]|nr:hypothetical protein FRB96_001264 [Tulasnella sp. 330]